MGKKFLYKEFNKTKFKFWDGLKSTMADKQFRAKLASDFKSNLGKDKRALIRFFKDKKIHLSNLGLKRVLEGELNILFHNMSNLLRK